VAEFSSSGHLSDITDDVVMDSNSFFGWSPGIYENKIYAHPWILGTRVLYINTDLLKKAGFDKDYLPYNWPQLKEVCYKIDSLDDDIYGFGSNAAEKHRLYKKWMPFFWSHDGRIISLDGKYCVISSDKAYKALKFYKELNDSCSMIDTQRRLEDAFLAGKIGVVISGDWLLKRINNEDHQINFVTSIMPGPVYPGKSFAGGEYLAIGEKSDNKKEALDFIKYITNKDNQLLFCKANYSANPSHKMASTDPYFTDDIHLSTFIRQINQSEMPPAIPEWVYVEDIIEKMLEDVLFNNAPIAESLYEAKHKIEKLLLKK
jgi:ABC-type glycerol-3-phosphate transport system substrate-binding protein